MRKTILIVDDDDGLRDFLKKVLSANNFKVIEASDGAQALEYVEKYLPDLVLLDFGLPKVDGATVCVKIKKDHPNIIVIALTEKNGSSDVVHGLQIGADDYISKPFDAEELIARIDTRFKNSTKEQVDASLEESDTEAPSSGKIILKESIVVVIIRLILTEAFFGFSLLLFTVLYSYLNSYLASDLGGVYFIVLGAAFLINIGA